MTTRRSLKTQAKTSTNQGGRKTSSPQAKRRGKEKATKASREVPSKALPKGRSKFGKRLKRADAERAASRVEERLLVEKRRALEAVQAKKEKAKRVEQEKKRKAREKIARKKEKAKLELEREKTAARQALARARELAREAKLQEKASAAKEREEKRAALEQTRREEAARKEAERQAKLLEKTNRDVARERERQERADAKERARQERADAKDARRRAKEQAAKDRLQEKADTAERKARDKERAKQEQGLRREEERKLKDAAKSLDRDLNELGRTQAKEWGRSYCALSVALMDALSARSDVQVVRSEYGPRASTSDLLRYAEEFSLARLLWLRELGNVEFEWYLVDAPDSLRGRFELDAAQDQRLEDPRSIVTRCLQSLFLAETRIQGGALARLGTHSVPAWTSPSEIEVCLRQRGLDQGQARALTRTLGKNAFLLLESAATEEGRRRADVLSRARKGGSSHVDSRLVAELNCGPVLDRAILAKALKEHTAFLESGGAGGSFHCTPEYGLPCVRYDGAVRGGQISIAFENLSGLKLANENLAYANLCGVRANQGVWTNVDLRGSCLRYAHLENIKLAGADLSGCDMSHAKLAGADFRRANLSGTSFESADLTSADFTGAQTSGTKFGGAIVVGIKY